MKIGSHMTREQKARLSAAHLGKQAGDKNPNWAKSPSDETRAKMRSAHLGHRRNEEVRAKIRAAKLGDKNPMWGKHLSPETRAKLSIAHAGQAVTLETRIKIKNAILGCHRSEITRAKLRAARAMTSPETRAKLRIAASGDKNANWRGGIHVSYGPEFNHDLRETIRKRDNFLCQNPRCYLSENRRKHSIHHIDFCKSHNDCVNLITLCGQHHSKTNNGDRDYWMRYYHNLQTMRGLA
jgi:hypothetical protein